MLRILVACWLIVPVVAHAQSDTVPVGVAKVDITPSYPIRLAGYGFRRAESEGVVQKLYAKAMVIGDQEPVMVYAIDICGLSHEFVEKLAATLREKLGMPRDRLAVTVTHTHTAPMVDGYLPTLFGVAIPAEHQAKIDRYTSELMAKLVTVGETAWKQRQLSRLSWGVGTVEFAKNRRPMFPLSKSPSPLTPLPNGERGTRGPVDHDMPLLAVRDLKGKLRAVWINYACHCTTLSWNKITGDWAGFAAQYVEEANPGAVALISIGCGADSNPERADRQDKVEYAEKQGSFIAVEATRLLSGFLAPLPAGITTKYTTFTLPLAATPSEATFKERAQQNNAVGFHARLCLERLAKGDKLPTEIPYSVQTWSFGNDMAMVFLPGEVVVDYALRLKRELHAQRLWVNGYSNHVPCYIPSERILIEGGYEGGAAMTYYNLPAPLASGLEQKIISNVKEQLPGFTPPFDVNKLAGSTAHSAQQSAAMIKLPPGLQIELMACEPLVVDPVAIAFGPDGRLWVAEMCDYPNGLPVPDPKHPNPTLQRGKIPGGRIKVLEDTDGDGKFDKATIFLDNIPFPTGITVWRKGVLICAAPDILYAEDSTGSGKADIVKKLYSGFGTHNYQARVNSLEYGLDGWVHGSCGLFGGEIKSFNGKTYALGNRDFRIKPDTGELEAATGQTQQGRVRDDYDNWFGCDNTVLGTHYPIPDHYLSRNAYLKPPNNTVFLPTAKDANRLFTLKQQVQLFELSGPPGWPTAACGLGVYRDSLLGNHLKDNLYTCEAVNLLVHRLHLKPSSGTFIGERAGDEPASEFLASVDNWFRPAQMRTGPDGCIWIVDMHRLVIEHPMWIPPADLAKLDVRAGSTMGRLYRVKPANGDPRRMPRLDQLDEAQLVDAMNSPNGTQRDLAMMMLLWKNELNGVGNFDALRASWLPAVRLQALATLSLLGKLDDRALLHGLHDQHPDVRKTAWRLAEEHKNFPNLLQALLLQTSSLTKEPVQVLMHMAWSLGTWNDARAGSLLATILETHPGDEYLQAAVLSALRPVHHEVFLTAITQAAHRGLYSPEFMKQLIPVMAQGDASRVLRLLRPLSTPAEKGYASWQYQAVASLPIMQEATVAAEYLPYLKPMYAAAKLVLQSSAASEAERLAALSMLLGPGQNSGEQGEGRSLLFTLLGPASSPALQQAALTLLAKQLDAKEAEQLLGSWMTYSPTLRSRLIDLFLSRTGWQQLLMKALLHKQIPTNHLDASSKQRLLHSKEADVRTAASQLFHDTVSNRASLIAEYSKALAPSGNVQHGKELFTKVCSVCHQLGEQGHAVGPDLTALANRTANFLLQEILDPNKNLDNRYIEYVAVTKQGRTLTGLLTNESGNSITLKGKEGRTEKLLRSEIDELQASGKSLMPEGLEKEINPAAMNDLIAYLGSLRQNYKSLAGNTPTGTIIAVNKVHTLHASQAEIYGQQITFEKDYQNVGMWHGANDYVSWTIDVPTKGEYDVYFDWACANDNAGNQYVLEIGSTTVNGEIAGTGGWSQFLRVRIAGGIELNAGIQRVKIRPVAPLKGALMDLRTVYVAPAEHRLNLAEGTLREKPDVSGLAHQILDDKLPEPIRQELIAKNLALAPELIVAMTSDMPKDLKEEYRRIPWMWRVAIASAKQYDIATLPRLLDVGMPQVDAPLRDWQAVVVGGGIINGIGLIDRWPHETLGKLTAGPAMHDRWLWLLKQAHLMAANEKVHTGTRYDALRIVALDAPERAIPVLQKYLPAGGNEEMQMGAVSGLVDVPTGEADKLLADALGHLKGENRELALIGMMRSAERFSLVLDQVEAGKLPASAFDSQLRERLQKRAAHWPQQLQDRVKRVVK